MYKRQAPLLADEEGGVVGRVADEQVLGLVAVHEEGAVDQHGPAERAAGPVLDPAERAAVLADVEQAGCPAPADQVPAGAEQVGGVADQVVAAQAAQVRLRWRAQRIAALLAGQRGRRGGPDRAGDPGGLLLVLIVGPGFAPRGEMRLLLVVVEAGDRGIRVESGDLPQVDPLQHPAVAALVLGDVGPAGRVADLLPDRVGAVAVAGQQAGQLAERLHRVVAAGLLQEVVEPAAQRVGDAEQVAAVRAPGVLGGVGCSSSGGRGSSSGCSGARGSEKKKPPAP